MASAFTEPYSCSDSSETVDPNADPPFLVVGDDDTDLVVFSLCSPGHPINRLPLHRGQWLRVGTAADNDIVIVSSAMSRHHFDITVSAEGAIYARDTHSASGTHLNDTRIMVAHIRARDRLHHGGAVLFFFPQHDRRWLELPVLELGRPLVPSPRFSDDPALYARLGTLLNG